MKIVILLVSALVGLATGPQTIEIQETNNNNQAGGARSLPTVTWRRTVANVPIEVPEKYKLDPMSKIFLYGSACYLYRTCSYEVFQMNYVPNDFSLVEYQKMLKCQYESLGLMKDGVIVRPKTWSVLRFTLKGLYQRARVIYDKCQTVGNHRSDAPGNALRYAKCALRVAESELFEAPVSQFMRNIPTKYLEHREEFRLHRQTASPL